MTHKTRSDYLENSPSIPLHLPLARVFGVNAAIILQQIRYWMSLYQKAEQSQPNDNRQHWHDDRWWVYNTYEQWQSDNFDFWSKSTIQRHINDLENKDVLISGEFNKSSGDRTKWYTINFDVMDKLVSENEGSLTPSSQNEQTIYSNSVDHLVKMTSSIYKDTETTTETTISTGAKSAPVPQPEKPKRKRKTKVTIPAERMNPMKDAIVLAFRWNAESMNKSEWGKVQGAARLLCESGVTVDEVYKLYNYCRGKFSDFGPAALATNVQKWRKSLPSNGSAPAPSTTTAHDTRTQLGLVDA